MESAKRGLRGDPGVGDGQDDGTRDKSSSSPSSLQTLSAEMRKVAGVFVTVEPLHEYAMTISAWADQLDASAARQEERIQELEHERDAAQAQCVSAERALNGAYTTLDRAEARVAELERELARQEEAIRQQENKLAWYEEEFGNMSGHCSLARERAEAAEAKLRVQEEAIRQLQEACEELDQRRLTMEIHSDEVARQAQDDLALRKAAEAENQQLTAEIRSLRETRQENKDEKVTRVDGQS